MLKVGDLIVVTKISQLYKSKIIHQGDALMVQGLWLKKKPFDVIAGLFWDAGRDAVRFFGREVVEETF